jgi:uncharacterized protein (TIGR04141 family)
MSPSSSEIKKHKLTVFLIKEEYEEIADFLSIDGFEQVDAFEEGKWQGALIYKGGFQSTPSWVSIFDELPGFDPSGIKNQSSKALYVLRCEGRWFCFTFGYARHLIDEHAYERNFGLIVTLNLSDPEAVKSIDKTNISHISLHSREQATRAIELGGFEFDNDIDLLKSITAKSSVSGVEEQETLSGRDSVSIYTRALVEDFHDIAERLYEAFTDTKYKELYPWIDKISEERDKTVVEQLDKLLAERIVNGELVNIWLAIPEVVDWEEIRGFAYKYRQERPDRDGPVLYTDLDVHEWVSVKNLGDELSAQQLKSKRIHVYWQDGRTSSWSVYRCLNAELDLDGKKYILNDSAWYNIQTDFVSEVGQFFSSIPEAAFSLPPFDNMNEPEYLEHVSSQLPEYALMDRKNIMIGGGRSKVEFCDLYSLGKDIIHVKRYGGSPVLSHLFSQAVVSGECFLHEEDFRTQLNEKLPDSHKLTDASERPAASHYNVCIAIMSKEQGDLELPFFSKVSFKHAVRALQNLGYNVFKLKIDRWNEESDA